MKHVTKKLKVHQSRLQYTVHRFIDTKYKNYKIRSFIYYNACTLTAGYGPSYTINGFNVSNNVNNSILDRQYNYYTVQISNDDNVYHLKQ